MKEKLFSFFFILGHIRYFNADREKLTMKVSYLISVFILLALFSCATQKKTYVLSQQASLPAGSTVRVLGIGQEIPRTAKLIGNVSVGDSGFTTKCSYAQVILDIQNQAIAIGGNIVAIRKHKEPDFWSTCHRISADVYLD